MEKNKRAVGNEKETLASKYLEDKGYKILDRNFYTRNGEIDIIATEGGYLVFVEVRYKRHGAMVKPEESISYKKIFHIVNAAKFYMASHGYKENTPVRFDFVGIYGNEISHIKNAVEGF